MTRPTNETLILMFGATVCSVLLLTVATLLVVELVTPETDISDTAAAVAGLLNTMLGLVVGFLAGRAGRREVEK